jgi:uncharacterized protein YcfL
MRKIMLLLTLTIFAYTNSKSVQINTIKREQRVALVIGNSNYTGVLHKLNNPINDARDIKDILEKRGFEVIYATDINLRTTEAKLEEFYTKIEKGAVGLLYFSGHGIEVGGQNYLIPLGAKLNAKSDAKYQSLSLNMILDRMKNSRNRLNIVILDACRNDPFTKAIGSGGLAEVIPPRGVFVAYSTGVGRTSSDGRVGENGLYTKYLIKNMKQSFNLYDLFKTTKDEVFRDSNWKQNPSIYDESIGTFYFTPPTGGNKIETKPINPPQIKYNKPDNMLNRGVSANISSSLQNKISVTQKSDNELKTIVTIENHENRQVTVYHRYKWFDIDGVEVGEGMSIWQPEFIQPNESINIRVVPPVPNAVSGKLYLK